MALRSNAIFKIFAISKSSDIKFKNQGGEMTISQKLNEILIKKDCSQEQLARELKVAPSQISRWINGDFTPRRRSVARINKIFENLN